MKTKLNHHVADTTPTKLTLLAILIASASLTIAQAQVPIFAPVWSVGSGTNASAGLPEDLPAAGNNVRGIAIDPATMTVLYASTTAGTNSGNNHFTALDIANSGDYLGQANGSGIGGGTLNLTQIRVADDGAVYACNLAGAPASNFRIYKWPAGTDFSTAPTVVFETGAGLSFQWRLGDYMDLRGSGANTEIVVVGNGSGANVTTNFVIFRPTDETATVFTNFSITIPGGAINRCGAGVTFEGNNNAIYCRAAGAQTVYRVTYNPDTLSATIASTFNMDQSANNGLKFYETNGIKLIATVCTSTGTTTNGIVHHAKVLQLNTASNATVVLNQPLPQPFQANGNSLGLVDFRAGYAAFSEPNNGISLYQITGFITNTPPALGGAPTGGGIYVEGYSPVTLAVSAAGSAPLSYQWYFNTNTPIVGATTNSLALGTADLADSGVYNVIVTNNFGSVTSSFASVTVVPAGYSAVAAQAWALAPGSRDYLTANDTQRGMAFDPVSQSLVLVSRAPTNGIHVLSAATGADLGELDVSLLSAGTPPGFFPINAVAVAADGAVYAANLVLNASVDTFAIYRWQDTTNGTGMSVAYFNTPGFAGRLGDTLIARGSGVDTELLASFNASTNIALFNTLDGFNFNFNVIAVTNLPADAQANGFARLGVAFGPTNTFWAKSSGFNLRLVRYDVATGTGEVIATYPSIPGSIAPIGVDNSNNLLAGIAITQIPQNLALYDLLAAGEPALVDRELYAVNNPNINGTGTVAFDIAGGRIFSLDSNNGILALNYAPRLYITPEVNGGVVTWTGPGTLQAAGTVTGTYTNVPGATSPYTNPEPGTLFFRVAR
jgi:hypothetical protein